MTDIRWGILATGGIAHAFTADLATLGTQSKSLERQVTFTNKMQDALEVGIGNLVDFDQTVEAMRKVGRTLPFELRESALGGIAAAPTACAYCPGCN